MSNLYRKLQWRALRPNGDNIQPYKIECLAQNETKSQSLFTLLKINDMPTLRLVSSSGPIATLVTDVSRLLDEADLRQMDIGYEHFMHEHIICLGVEILVHCDYLFKLHLPRFFYLLTCLKRYCIHICLLVGLVVRHSLTKKAVIKIS